ncbi:MAG: ABC transporter permease [Magnetovibrionaceae bacterium]
MHVSFAEHAFVAHALRRLAVLVMTLVGLSIAVFLVAEGTPERLATAVLGPLATEQQLADWLSSTGYDRPLAERYFSWAGGVLRGDLGQSLLFQAPVDDVLIPRLWASLTLGLAALGIFVPLGLVLGFWAGFRKRRLTDRIISWGAILVTSMPEYALALIGLAIFVFWLDWLPGASPLLDGPSLQELALPAGVLALIATGHVARLTRAAVVDAMGRPYIKAARLKGIQGVRLALRHLAPNILSVPITMICLHINWLLSGVIAVEVAFGYPGFGTLVWRAALAGDVAVLEAAALIAGAVALFSQSVADLASRSLKPAGALQ